MLDSHNKIAFVYEDMICSRSATEVSNLSSRHSAQDFPRFHPGLLLHFKLISTGLSDVWSVLSESMAQGSCTHLSARSLKEWTADTTHI